MSLELHPIPFVMSLNLNTVHERFLNFHIESKLKSRKSGKWNSAVLNVANDSFIHYRQSFLVVSEIFYDSSEHYSLHAYYVRYIDDRSKIDNFEENLRNITGINNTFHVDSGFYRFVVEDELLLIDYLESLRNAEWIHEGQMKLVQFLLSICVALEARRKKKLSKRLYMSGHSYQILEERKEFQSHS